MLRSLEAGGPLPGLEERLALFGRFVGDWEITDCRYLSPEGRWRRLVGELHWGWILRGRALQDVWTLEDPATGELVYEGTTVRLYDPSIGRWRSTWISATGGTVRSFVGGAHGEEIVLDEQVGPGVPAERWVFTSIRPGAFSWYSERHAHDGRGWHRTEEMRLRRASP